MKHVIFPDLLTQYFWNQYLEKLLFHRTLTPERGHVNVHSLRAFQQTWKLLEFVLVSELHVVLVRAQPGR